MDLSIVIPVYNEEESVDLLCQKLDEALQPLSLKYEAVLVDDGSRDKTWQMLLENKRKYPYLHLIRFRRNFGQTAAMAAGLDAAEGNVIITMDADLQNDPKDIPLLLEAMTDEVDVVSGWRKDRKDTFINRRLPSMMANGLISKITGVHLHDYGCTLKAYRKDVIKDVRLYGEMHRFIPALAHWVGGKVIEIPVSHHARQFGTSKYGIGRTFRVVLDLITVKFLMRYSTGPMQILGKIGFQIGFVGALLIGVIFSLNLFATLTGLEFWGDDLVKRPVWPIMGFMFMAFGIQFIGLGLLSEMTIRTYHESQDKRIYAVREEVLPED
ncbi:glycosyltransferase family 2 protein [Kiritimatiellota bacterium B12222]|nr:glycosyltransferase family 2 protein [Kiritimatiellota bacterium B12222]